MIEKRKRLFSIKDESSKVQSKRCLGCVLIEAGPPDDSRDFSRPSTEPLPARAEHCENGLGVWGLGFPELKPYALNPKTLNPKALSRKL